MEGYCVIHSSSGESAKKIICENKEPVDLILMDIDLGAGCDGIETAKEILKYRDIPIIFISSHSEREIIEKTEKIMSYGFIVKNSGISVINASIKMAFKLFEARQKIIIHERALAAEKASNMLNAYNRSLIESSLDPFITIGPDGIITDVNKAAESVFELNRNELAGTDLSGYFIEAEKVKEVHRAAFKNGSASGYTFDIKNRSGRIITVLYNASVYRDEAGKIIGLFAAARDITERKKAEEALIKAEQRTNALYNIFRASNISENEIIGMANEHIVKLTGSELAFIGLIDEDEKIMHAHLWSQKAMQECTIDKKPVRFPIESAGIWAEPIRQKKVVIINDYLNEGAALKKGLPEGHIAIKRFLGVPVMRGGRVVMIAAVANKNNNYAEDDIDHISLFLEGVLERINMLIASEKIRNLLSEKELILKEVHHRLKNNMNSVYNMLALEYYNIDDPVAKNVLQDSAGRVKSMMVLYDKLYRSTDERAISIKEYLPPLIDEITGVFMKVKPVKIKTELADIILKADILSSLGIMINEFITNSMKYAFNECSEGLIRVTALKVEDKVRITFEDNGPGISESITFENSDGFGMQLIKIMTKQMNASVNIQRDNGTKFIIELAA